MPLLVVVEGATVDDSVEVNSIDVSGVVVEVEAAGGAPVKLDSEADGEAGPDVSEAGGPPEVLGPADDSVPEAGGGAGVVSVEGADVPDCGGGVVPVPDAGGVEVSVKIVVPEAPGVDVAGVPDGATEDGAGGAPLVGGAPVAGGAEIGGPVGGTAGVAVQDVTVTVTVTVSGSRQGSVNVKSLIG